MITSIARLSCAERLRIAARGLYTLMLFMLLSSSARAALQGIDVSRFQGIVNWASVNSGGVDFGFAKATEGVDFIDIRFATNMTNARNAGVPIGPYHFGRPDSSVGTLADPVKQDAINEANDFVDAIKPYYDSFPGEYLRPVLDVERLPSTAEINTTSEKKQYLSDWVRDFNSVVQSRLGIDVIIYANSSYANTYFESNISSFDLWLARWTHNTSNQPTQANLGIWDNWAFWQWTDNWSVGGLSPVDGDYFAGDLNDLQAFIVGGDVVLAGDYNDDGIVGAADYAAWLDSLGSSAGTLPNDTDGGVIGQAQYDTWKTNFGNSAAESVLAANVATPEPASWLLLFLASLCVCMTSRVVCNNFTTTI